MNLLGLSIIRTSTFRRLRTAEYQRTYVDLPMIDMQNERVECSA